jgi:pimeloyl-ACP methyl ester carboxylesterase
MARFILIPGAGGVAWYWHRVIPLLERAGHEAVAVDLPGDAGLPAYTDLTLAAIGNDPRALVVAQSLGGFTAAMVAARTPLAGLIFVNAMIPNPGETAGDWGDAVGSTEARVAAAKRHGYSEKFELHTYFFHDVPAEIVKEADHHEREQSEAIFGDKCDFTAWPKIPIRAIAGADDRLFPVDFQRKVARDRLGIELEVVPGGHLAALSHPTELAAALVA